MTDEQERSIEALSLRMGGFAATGTVELVNTSEGLFAVRPNGDVYTFDPAYKLTTYRRFMADTYGVGATP